MVFGFEPVVVVSDAVVQVAVYGTVVEIVMVPQPVIVVPLLVKLTVPVGAIVAPEGRPMIAVKTTC
jgi:hypothetical protein